MVSYYQQWYIYSVLPVRRWNPFVMSQCLASSTTRRLHIRGVNEGEEEETWKWVFLSLWAEARFDKLISSFSVLGAPLPLQETESSNSLLCVWCLWDSCFILQLILKTQQQGKEEVKKIHQPHGFLTLFFQDSSLGWSWGTGLPLPVATINPSAAHRRTGRLQPCWSMSAGSSSNIHSKGR